MSKSTKALNSSIGTPFWLGCFISPVLFLIVLAAFGALQDRFTLELFGFIALVVFAPLGGAAFQAAYDLLTAHRIRVLQMWDYTAFLGISIALIIAAYALLRAPEKDLSVNLFNNKAFDAAVWFVFFVLVFYSLRDFAVRLFPRQPSDTHITPDVLPQNIRAFAAVGFIFLSSENLAEGLYTVWTGGVGAGSVWLISAGAIIASGIGICLGLGVYSGNPIALRVARLLLFLTVVGGIFAFLMPLLHLWPRESARDMANLVICATILVMIRKRAS